MSLMPIDQKASAGQESVLVFQQNECTGEIDVEVGSYVGAATTSTYT